MAKAGSDSSLDLRFECISPLQQLNKRKGLQIQILFGDIFESTADAIVVPEGTSFKHMGFVARQLTQIEPKYEEIRKELVGTKKSFTPWEVYTEKLGKKFQYVVCAIVPACKGDVEEWKQKFKLLYKRIFREADRKIISAVAVPLIGSGRGGATQEDAIEMALASAFEFKGSNITKISFVSNDENTVTEMASACRHMCGGNPQSGTQVRPKSSATHRPPSTGPSSSISDHRRERPKNGTNVCSSQTRPGQTNRRSSVNSMTSFEIDVKGLTPRDGVRGSKEGEKRSRASGRGRGDKQKRSLRDTFTSDLTFVGTTRVQERQKGNENHRLRDRKSELTRVNNALDDETCRNDVHVMNQMDRRPDVNRRNHFALPDDRKGIVIGLQQNKIKNHIYNYGFDKYDDDESHYGDVHTDIRRFHRSIDKYSQERKLCDGSGMDENRYDETQGNGEVLVDRSVKSTGETFNHMATTNKGQQISENGVLWMGGQNNQHGGIISSETEMKHQISGVAQSSLKERKMEALHSKLEPRDYGYQSKIKVKSNVHSESLTSKSEKNGQMYEVFGDVGSGETPNQFADDRKHSDQGTKEEINKSQGACDKQSCPICLEDMTDPKFLDKCGHVFCRDCIDDSFKHYKPVCPSCNMVYGILKGNQPDGNMDVGFSGDHLPGYEGHGTVTITYYFPSGIQGGEHPNPGQPYKGTTRRAYLPDCPEGREVLKLLKTAFDRKLTFTIGRSTTTGQENVVTWNDIHHKTNMDGGPTRFGYPDPGYMTRVKEELASKGVTG